MAPRAGITPKQVWKTNVDLLAVATWGQYSLTDWARTLEFMEKLEIECCHKINQWMVKMGGVDSKYEHNCNCVLWCRNSINYIDPHSCTDHENSLLPCRMFEREAFWMLNWHNFCSRTLQQHRPLMMASSQHDSKSTQYKTSPPLVEKRT